MIEFTTQFEGKEIDFSIDTSTNICTATCQSHTISSFDILENSVNMENGQRPYVGTGVSIFIEGNEFWMSCIHCNWSELEHALAHLLDEEHDVFQTACEQLFNKP